jgi:citrate synthase
LIKIDSLFKISTIVPNSQGRQGMDSGLDDVVAAETILSDVDGERGQLIIRGISLDQLSGRTQFHEAVHLLFDGFFEGLPDKAGLADRLGTARVAVFEKLSPQLNALVSLPPYEAMRAGVAMLTDGHSLDDALHLVAGPAVLLPALLRIAKGEPAIPPDERLHHAQDVLSMLGTTTQSAALAAALDAYLVTVCDHGLNASTFASRVVASTQAGLCSSVLAGMGALKGPLHGGAPGPIIGMLDTMQAVADPRAWLKAQVATGARLMGFGHRIYRVRDPRADALKGALRRLSETGAGTARVAFAEQAEQLALEVLRSHKPDRILETNVEFYTALLLEAVGFPSNAFTAVFAMGRVAGWIAHAREQALTGRLIRPLSKYVGPVPSPAS